MARIKYYDSVSGTWKYADGNAGGTNTTDFVKSVNGIEPDENGNIDIEIPEIDVDSLAIKPDWNQNDENELDYIKNRTHWLEDNGIKEVEIVPENTVFIDDQDDGEGYWYDYYCTDLSGPFGSFVAGHTYVVVFDGVEYECVARGDWGGLGDSNMIYDRHDENAEPFYISSFVGNFGRVVELYAKTEMTHTVRVYTMKQDIVYHPLAEAYIPETIARADDVICTPATAEPGQLLTVKNVDEDGKPTEWEAADAPESPVQPDLEQWDDTALDYVKGRTHWVEYPAIIPKQKMDMRDTYDRALYYTREKPTPGETYRVCFDGIYYDCVVREYSVNVLMLGNGPLCDCDGISNGEPFAIVWYRNSTMVMLYVDTNGYHTVSVHNIEPAYHPLDEKFIPESIPRFADIKWDNLSNKPFGVNTAEEVISWDGDIDGRDSFQFNSYTYYKVSDLTPSYDELIGGTHVRIEEGNYHTSDTLSSSNLTTHADVAVSYGKFVVIYKPGVTFTDRRDAECVAPSAGIYGQFTPYDGLPWDVRFDKLTYNKSVVTPLDDAYIPDTIARVSDVQQGGSGSFVQPDLNQNDETAPDYVKGRTHWMGDPVHVTIYEGTDTAQHGVAHIPCDVELEVGATYVVTFDGTEYTCLCENIYGNVCIGNMSVVWDDYDGGVPFCYQPAYEFLCTLEAGPHTIKIATEEDVIIDEMTVVSVGELYNVYPNDIIEVGAECTVTIGENVYTGVWETHELGEYIGNVSMITHDYDGSGVPFCYLYHYADSALRFYTAELGELDIKITTAKRSIHKIDAKYLPEAAGLPVANKEMTDRYGAAFIGGYGAEIFNDYRTNVASGEHSHAEGSETKATGINSHAEGHTTEAAGWGSHAEGSGTKATSDISHAEGSYTEAAGYSSHAEGYETKTAGHSSHAEGAYTEATGNYSHAEGNTTKATGYSSHAEGHDTEAAGSYSHAEGRDTEATGDYSHAEGRGTVAHGRSLHVQGEYNAIDDSVNQSLRSKYAHIVGNGTSDDNRSNAHTIDWNGVAWYRGRPQFGGNAQDDRSQSVMANGDTEIFLTSPGGKKFAITVDDDGTITATEV